MLLCEGRRLQLMYCLACQLQIFLGHHRIQYASNDSFVLLASCPESYAQFLSSLGVCCCI